MNKMNGIYALLLGALVCLTACSKEDELSPEELEAKQTKELLEKISDNYSSFTSKKWAYKDFVFSDDLLAASKTEDGIQAKTIVDNASQASNFNMELTFEEVQGDSLKVNVDFNLTDEQIDAKLLEYQDAIYPDFSAWGMGLILGKEETLAQLRRVIASPIAADDLKTAEITDLKTGLCKFKIGKADFAKLMYEDLVLSQKKLIGGNNDKIYLNEDGTLTVESTHTDYGVSKLILEEVKN